MPFVNKKSLCFGDSKHIFKLKIVRVFPEKNGFIVFFYSKTIVGRKRSGSSPFVAP
jgi:hypothetical protein